jgi:DNA-directed RNA polymerase specialized sigma24 family protein
VGYNSTIKNISHFFVDLAVTQETLLAIHNRRHTHRSDLPLTAWVYGIARYKFFRLLRARSAREELNEPLDDDPLLFADSDNDAHRSCAFDRLSGTDAGESGIA